MDSVNHPPHYQEISEVGKRILLAWGIPEHLFELECIEAIEYLNANFCTGNAIKYLWRAGLKGDLREDLLKARWYLARLYKSEKIDVIQVIDLELAQL